LEESFDTIFSIPHTDGQENLKLSNVFFFLSELLQW